MTVSRGELLADWNLGNDFRIATERLHLVPSGQELANTNWDDHDRLSQLLNARIPSQWPPDLVRDTSSPNGEGWWNWYVIKRENDARDLIGIMGLKGWPNVGHSVQMGCSFLPDYQKSGYGTEAVDGLTTWALTQFEQVIAETPLDNAAAASVLRRLGFGQVASDDPALLRFEKSAKSLGDYRAR
jgi:RimJ/RimL family protein N-acetyltransferase